VSPGPSAAVGSPKVLLVNPQFNGDSFWAYKPTCRLIGKSYPTPSLGLITVAAMLPAEWNLRLVDRNVDEDEESFEALLQWADLVLVGGMLWQQRDFFAVIERAKAAGKPVAVGGPDVSSSPEIYERADFRIVGEAEGCIADFIAAWRRGEREGEFRAPLYSIDITRTPPPRFDLLDLSQYAEITVQFSRGCPFRCEFCDIIELYGRNPRTKTAPQMLAELQLLYDLGYRGMVQFSDDNLIGNKKAVKAFLPELIGWQKAHNYPFEFDTEASLNLADDVALLMLMRDANFIAVFIGIESPDPVVLAATLKKQNINRDIVASIRRIQGMGILVGAGFIVGFDSERASVSKAMIDLIEEAAIPASMVGQLYALPNTQLTRRLEKEGRLAPQHQLASQTHKLDQFSGGLNFQTLRPRREVLQDYRNVLEYVFRPEIYFARIRRMADHLDCSGLNGQLHPGALLRGLRQLARFAWSVGVNRRDLALDVLGLTIYVLHHNPRALRSCIYMAGLFAHFGRLSRAMVVRTDRLIEGELAAGDASPMAARIPALAHLAAPPPAAVEMTR
jgi:radical SAM superfamily enzyme YgiQ (UPF0313 family)